MGQGRVSAEPALTLFPPLPEGAVLHVCLICGGVIADRDFHDEWHRETDATTIATARRLDSLEGGNRV